MKNMTRETMLAALKALDETLDQSVSLVIGGGAAMVLAHGYQLGTFDIDAVPKGIDIATLDPYVKKIATRLGLAPDWLNPYYSTFSHTLPPDYSDRLVEVFKGTHLTALALGLDEMLIMKCFAHRQKDVNHAKALIKKGASIKNVEARIEQLRDKNIPLAAKALDFLDDVMEQMDG
ncbi:MAG: hypothetical protein A2583_08150 [Bdellovibrionales bacterium RIFOXYD1_FULL_53_11]|nr:MAG: hypothetical protein A2583_08150 [Bdellovibrionales bacterium RIFOXYD1_FULL_53_11]